MYGSVCIFADEFSAFPQRGGAPGLQPGLCFSLHYTVRNPQFLTESLFMRRIPASIDHENVQTRHLQFRLEFEHSPICWT